MAPKSQLQRRKTVKNNNGNLIGLLLFACGLGAILAVFYLGYDRYVQSGEFVGQAENIKTLDQGAPAVQNSLSADQERAYSGETNVSEGRVPSRRDLIGKWQSLSQDKRAYVSFYDDQFQMLYIDSPEREARSYSAGLFEYNEETGIMRLIPNREATNELVGDVVTNSLITMRQFEIQMIYDAQNGGLFWQVPASGQTRIHPLFYYMRREDRGIMGWMRAQ